MCRGTIYVGRDLSRIIELSNGKYYVLDKRGADSKRISDIEAFEYATEKEMVPLVISGGVNKFFSLPVDKSEITKVHVLKR